MAVPTANKMKSQSQSRFEITIDDAKKSPTTITYELRAKNLHDALLALKEDYDGSMQAEIKKVKQFILTANAYSGFKCIEHKFTPKVIGDVK